MLNLTCEMGQVFLHKVLYGYKPLSLNCSADGFTRDCTDKETCCTSAGGACFKPYTVLQFDRLHHCFGVKSCSEPGQRGAGGCSDGSGNVFSDLSSFSLIEYSCLNASTIIDFSSLNTTVGRAVAIVYKREEPSKNSLTTWFCHVNSTSGNVQTNVMLSMRRNRNKENSGCSSIGFDLDTLLPCGNNNVSYTSTQRITPFDVVLQMGDSSNDTAHVVARAVSDAQLSVTCGGTQPTSGGATSTPADAVTSVTPGSTSSPPGVETSSPQTPGGASSTPGQGTRPPGSSGTSNQGVHIIGVAVAGWVLVMLLLIVLTVLSVLLYRHGLCHKKKSTYGGSSSSRDPPADNTYLEVIPDPTVVSPRTTPSHVYVNEASDQTSSTSVEPGRESQNEYSPLERPRDQSNIYTSLRNA